MRKYATNSNIGLSIGVFLATDHYDHDNDPNTISTTTLIKSPRQIILSDRAAKLGNTGPVDPMGLWKSRIGTAIHDGIERAWVNNYKTALLELGYPKNVIDRIRVNPTEEEAKEPDIVPVYMEQRLVKQVGKWKVTGKFDFVGQGRLEDFKSTTAYVVKTKCNEGKFKLQGSIYRWLDPKLITHPNMVIQYIVLDWSAQDADKIPTPIHPVTIPLNPVDETQKYVEQKLHFIDKHWDDKEEDIPLCTEEDLQRTAPVHKYYKNGDSTSKRSTKNFTDLGEANIYKGTEGKGLGVIKTVPGEVTACQWCAAFSLCTQKDAYISNT